MRRYTPIAIALTAAAMTLTGCRSTCGERTGWFAGRNRPAACLTSGSNACRDVSPASFTPVALGDQPPAGWGAMPVYPAGEPIPVHPGVVGPENELPYGRIPAPNVPEAAPAPAIPQTSGLNSPSSRMTGTSKPAH